VLKKPGSFTPDERAVMNRHAADRRRDPGPSRIPLFQLAAEVALTHHERWDGSGYPIGWPARPFRCRAASWRWSTSSTPDDGPLLPPRLFRRPALEMLRAARPRLRSAAWSMPFEAALPQMVTLRDAVNRVEPSFAELVDGVAALKPATGVPAVGQCPSLPGDRMNTAIPCRPLAALLLVAGLVLGAAAPAASRHRGSTASRPAARCACASGPTTTASPGATRAPSS
jgi:hypothetical protein